jgi:hypothetical protein
VETPVGNDVDSPDLPQKRGEILGSAAFADAADLMLATFDARIPR